MKMNDKKYNLVGGKKRKFDDVEVPKKNAKQRRSEAKQVDFSVISEESRVISVSEYASCRAKELEAMAKAAAAKNIGNNKQIQLLPIHMRRRAMSHNVKRFPCRLRHAAEREGIGVVNKKTKRPSRKHRRRPKNLLNEYARRQRNHIWLETHIWHAKRFKMVEKWGYKIPLKSNFKGARASHRGAAKHCLLFDMSYLCCIEVHGNEDDIFTGLSHCMSEDDFEKSKVGQNIECKAVLYKCDSYPKSAIGPARILWQGKQDGGKNRAWIWVHPTCHNEVFQELEKAFMRDKNLPVLPPVDIEEKTDTSTQNKDQAKENPKFTIGGISLVSLKDELNRYSLLGPESQQIISQCFDVKFNANLTNSNVDNDIYQWWRDAYSGKNDEFGQLEIKTWEEFCRQESPKSYPDHSVLGFTVSDPRLSMPKKKEKFLESKESGKIDLKSNNTSLIWDPIIRQKVKSEKLSESQLNKFKGNNLVPGTTLDLGLMENKIPILLIQNHGKLIHEKAELPYGCGWDVIVPSGWGMPFWMAFVYRCARASALSDLDNLRIEQGIPVFPFSWPDCGAGKIAADDSEKELIKYHKKRPPAKRPNYKALKVSNPFNFPWSDLCKAWNNVLGIKMEQDWEPHVVRSLDDLKKLDIQNPESNLENMAAYVHKYPFALVSVHVQPILRGVPEQNAMICIPSNEDLEKYGNDKNYEGPKEDKSSKKDKKTNSEAKPILESCSRQCIGYVTQGKYAFTTGKGAGFGFCSLSGLYRMLNERNMQSTLVLIRNKSTLQYRFANVNILCVDWEL